MYSKYNMTGSVEWMGNRMAICKVPPMGWNSWNTFAENINEALIRTTADAMVESGLRDAGYEAVKDKNLASVGEKLMEAYTYKA